MLSAMGLQGASTQPYTVATVTLTNQANIVNGASIDLNSDVRRWTNATPADPSKWIVTTNTLQNSTTNLLRHLQLHAPSGPLSARTNNASATSFKVVGQPGQTLTVTISGNWAEVTYVTNQWTNSYPLVLPFTSEPNTRRTNAASDVVDIIDAYATNAFPEASRPMSNFVSRTASQHVLNKTLRDSTTSNTVHGGTISTLSGGVVHGTTLSNSTLKKVTITDTSLVQTVRMGEGNYLRLEGEVNTNWLVIGGLGNLYLLAAVTGHVPFTNAAPSGGEILNWDSLRGLFPIRQESITNQWGGTPVLVTNKWGSVNWYTNGPTNFVFFFGFRSTNAEMASPTFFGTVLGGSGPWYLSNLTAWAASLTATNATNWGGISSNMMHGHVVFSNVVFAVAGTNDVAGDWAWRQLSVSSIANGNNVAQPFTNVYVRIGGSPTAAFTINGILGGRNGRVLLIENDTGQSMTLAHESGVDPTAANRLQVPGGADATVPTTGWAGLMYNSTVSRWQVTWTYPALTAATNAIAQSDGSGTNLVVWPSTTNNVALTVRGLANQSNDVFQVKNSGGTTLLAVDAAGTLVSSNASVNRVALFNGNKQLTNSANVDATELEYVDGVTNAIQGQIHNRIWDWGAKYWGCMQHNGNASGWGSEGDAPSNQGSQTAAVPTATEGTMQNWASSAINGATAGFNGNPNYRMGRNVLFRARTKLQETANLRAWVGLSDQTMPTMAGADNPAGNYAAFRFSTAAGDANWKAITKDGSTQTVTDTGVAGNTTVRLFEIIVDGGNVIFRIDKTTSVTNSANLPVSGTNLRMLSGLATLEGVAKNIRCQFAYVESDL